MSGSRRARGAATASTTTSRTARRTSCNSECSGSADEDFSEKYGVDVRRVRRQRGARRPGRAAQRRRAANLETVIRRDARRPGAGRLPHRPLVELGEAVAGETASRLRPRRRTQSARRRPRLSMPTTLPGRAVRQARRRSSPTAPGLANGARGSTRSCKRATTAARCSWPAPPTSPNPPTSPASRKDFGRQQGLRLVRARQATSRARSCRRRSPSSPTRASWRHRHRQPLATRPSRIRRLLRRLFDLRLVQLPEVRPDAPVQPARAGLRRSRSARCSGSPATPAPRRPRTAARTSASSRRASPSSSPTAR